MRDHIAPKSIDPKPPRACVQPEVFGTCGRDVPEASPLSLCMSHLAVAWEHCQNLVSLRREEVGQQLRDKRNEQSVQVFFEGLDEKQQVREALAADPEIDDPDSVVYYIRFADRIKIGFSRNLGQRLINLPYDELLVVEPGANLVESRRHKQFGKDRIRGEWFASSPELLEHVAALKVKVAERMRWTEKIEQARRLDGPITNTEILATMI